MNRLSLRKLLGTFFLGLCAFALSGWAHADPPSRVARLAYVSGAVSFSPAGESDWVRASINRPLITGDRLWADSSSLGELQLGAAAIRMGSRTSMTLLNVDDRIAQVQLTQGTLNIRVWRFDRDHVFEIDTPNLAYSIRSPGSYRVEVAPNGGSTVVTVRAGQAEVYGEGRSLVIEAGQAFEFFDAGLNNYDSFALAPADDFDRWSAARDRRWENSASARYVSRDLIGYEDLDEYGSWRDVAGYGYVWTPTRVAVDWAPYHDGHWAWVEPWGWTWVDDAPWGFTPSHYGRWANIGGAWAWVPGPVAARPIYAPALVAFVGGSNFSVSLHIGGGGVAWFPLGPRDVYRPSYPVSRQYFTSVNTSNTVINTTHITNVYNNTNVTNVVYANQKVPGAVVAVPTTAFVQSRPVAREAVRVSRDMVATAPVMAVAPLAPVRTSVMGVAAPGARPPESAAVRPVVARTAPPPAPAPFAARQSALAAHPGRPLDAAAMSALRPAAPQPAAAVTNVTPPRSAALPPPPKPAGAATPEKTLPPAAPAPALSNEARSARPVVPGTPAPLEAGSFTRPPAGMVAPRNERRQSVEEERLGQPGLPQRRELARPEPQPAATPAAPVTRAARSAEEARPSRPPAIAPRTASPGPSAQEERARHAPAQRPAEAWRPEALPATPANNAGRPADPGRPMQQAPAAREVPPAQSRALPPDNRPPPGAAVLAPRAGGPVGAPAPQPAPVGNTLARQQRPEVGRRDAVSEASKTEEQRRQAEREQGRHP